MSQYDFTMTTAGLALLAAAQDGTEISFTRFAIGDGDLGELELADLTALISEQDSLAINGITVDGDQANITPAALTNAGLATGYRITELGLFADDPDGPGEILYCVANAGELGNYLPAESSSPVEMEFPLVVLVAGAENVSAVINTSLVYALQEDVDAAVTPLQNAAWRGWLLYRNTDDADDAPSDFDATMIHFGRADVMQGFDGAVRFVTDTTDSLLLSARLRIDPDIWTYTGSSTVWGLVIPVMQSDDNSYLWVYDETAAQALTVYKTTDNIAAILAGTETWSVGNSLAGGDSAFLVDITVGHTYRISYIVSSDAGGTGVVLGPLVLHDYLETPRTFAVASYDNGPAGRNRALFEALQLTPCESRYLP